MGIETLDNILKLITNRPLYGFILLLSAIFITLLFWYVSSYIKEAGKQRINRKKIKKSESHENLSKQNEQDEDIDNHFPSVTCTDGTLVDVIISIHYRIFDPVKYTYEASKPLEILKTVVDSRLRQIFEKITVEEARESRQKTENRLKNDLAEEFLRFGIKLESINIGAIHVKQTNIA